MGDGSSNILNKDSLSDFSGEYGFGDINDNLYKVRKVETSVSEFENYEDIDLESYIDYIQNYIEKYFG